MTRVLAIGGVFFKSDDSKTMRAWYGEVLGLPVDDWGASLKFHGLPKGSFAQWSPFPADTDYFDPGGRDCMINMLVDDAQTAIDNAVANGGTQIGEVQQLEYGEFGWFTDPEGRKVELVTMPGVRMVGGIFFKCKDPAAIRAWYGKALGMPVNDHGASLPFGIDLPPGAYCQWSPFKAETTYFGEGQDDMFNLIVDDVPEALAQVEAAGGTRVDGIEALEYGTFGWFLDPEGRKVELWMPAGEVPA